MNLFTSLRQLISVHTLSQVLTLPQYREMISPEPPKPMQLAKALFDFQGQNDRELSFNKVHVCTCTDIININERSRSHSALVELWGSRLWNY